MYAPETRVSRSCFPPLRVRKHRGAGCVRGRLRPGKVFPFSVFPEDLLGEEGGREGHLDVRGTWIGARSCSPAGVHPRPRPRSIGRELAPSGPDGAHLRGPLAAGSVFPGQAGHVQVLAPQCCGWDELWGRAPRLDVGSAPPHPSHLRLPLETEEAATPLPTRWPLAAAPQVRSARPRGEQELKPDPHRLSWSRCGG